MLATAIGSLRSNNRSEVSIVLSAEGGRDLLASSRYHRHRAEPLYTLVVCQHINDGLLILYSESDIAEPGEDQPRKLLGVYLLHPMITATVQSRRMSCQYPEHG